MEHSTQLAASSAGMVTEVTHPLVQHKLGLLRDVTTTTQMFRQLVNELTLLLTYEATKDLADEAVEIETPLEHMIWTLICFAITFFVLRKYAFGPIQRTIDERRDRIRKSVEEADNARAEAQQLLEQHRALIASAKSDAADILAEARKVGDAQIERVKKEAEDERQRRLEETKRQIDAETKRSLDLIRTEVADLTLEATARVTGKVLDGEDQRRLIDEAIAELDFSALEKETA